MQVTRRPCCCLPWWPGLRRSRAASCASGLQCSHIITRLIETIIIPLLPLHIFGIFLNLTYTGELPPSSVLLRVAVVVLVLEVVILLTQFCFAGVVARRNPIKALLR